MRLTQTAQIKKLKTLVQHHQKSHQEFKNGCSQDRIDHLSGGRQAGWRRVISSVATTEAIEGVLMNELNKAFQSDPHITTLLKAHQLDEATHFVNLSNYLKNTFNYVKKNRTLSDQIFYDTLFPKIARMFAQKPIYGLALILFLESQGILFYKMIHQKAKTDGLTELHQLIDQIEKDEHRHRAGIKLLLSLLAEEDSIRLTRWNKIILGLILGLAVVDLNLSAWGLHNRELRRHFHLLDLDSDTFTREAYRSAKHIYQEMVGQFCY